MKLLILSIVTLVLIGAGLFVWTSYQVIKIEQRFPPAGQFLEIAGHKLHFKDVAEAGNSDLPPLLFVHGASGNLQDQLAAFEGALKGRARMLFVDRPGHGYSERGGADDPVKQAQSFKLLLDELGIEQVVLVGHSLGSASVAAFAVEFPERVKGIVFLAPATHPWPGGVTWYYNVASLPVVGHLFTETLALPFGQMALDSGAASVFKPNDVPANYLADSAVELVFRPSVFRNNAHDVATLKAFVQRYSPRYKEIKKPVVIITGDKDDIVLPSIHSIGLERDIEGAELVVVPGLGHKPDYVATERVIEAIEKVAK